MVFLELYNNRPNTDFVLDEIKWGDIQENIKKYGVRNYMTTAVPPDYCWAISDLGTVEENIEVFEKMSKQEQGLFLETLEMSMALQGIDFPREGTDLHRLYYSKTINSKDDDD